VESQVDFLLGVQTKARIPVKLQTFFLFECLRRRPHFFNEFRIDGISPLEIFDIMQPQSVSFNADATAPARFKFLS
jgi:hypothetical protein